MGVICGDEEFGFGEVGDGHMGQVGHKAEFDHCVLLQVR